MQPVSPTTNPMLISAVGYATAESSELGCNRTNLTPGSSSPVHSTLDNDDSDIKVQIQRVASGKFLEIEEGITPAPQSSSDEVKLVINKANDKYTKERIAGEIGLESDRPWKRTDNEVCERAQSISRFVFMFHRIGTALGYELFKQRNILELMKMAEVNTATKGHVQRYFVSEAIQLIRSCSEQGCCSDPLLQDLKDALDKMDEVNSSKNQQLRSKQEVAVFNKYLKFISELKLLNTATAELHDLILNFAKKSAQVKGSTIALAIDAFRNGVPLSEYMLFLSILGYGHSENTFRNWALDCREYILKVVKEKSESNFELRLSPRLSSDREFIRAMTLQCPGLIRHASDEILKDIEFLTSLAKEVRQRKPDLYDIFLEGLLHCRVLIESLNDSDIRNDKEAFLLLAQRTKRAGQSVTDLMSSLMSTADLALQSDKNFMFELIRIDPRYIQNVSGDLRTLRQMPLYGRDSNDNPCIIDYGLCKVPSREMWLAALSEQGDLWDAEYPFQYITFDVKKEGFFQCMSEYPRFPRLITVLSVNQIPEYRLDEELAIAALKSLCKVNLNRALGLWRRFPSELQRNPRVFLALTESKQLIEGERDQIKVMLTDEDLKSNKNFFLEVVKQNGCALQYASAALRADKEVVLAAVNQNGMALQYATAALRADKEVVLEAVKQKGLALQYASAALREDKEVVLAAVNQNGMALQYASDALITDKEVVLEAVNQDGMFLQHASAALRSDKEVVLAAVKQKGLALQYASAALRADRDVVFAATQKEWFSFQFATHELRHDKPFIMELISLGLDSRFLGFVGRNLKNDPEFILSVVQKNGDCLMIASDALRENAQIVWAAVQQNAVALNFAGDRFKDDESLVLKVVSQDGAAFKYASDRLRGSEEVALTAVANNGMALRYASQQLQNSARWREIVLTAVRQNGNALAFAGPALKRDPQIVLAAVMQDGRALWCASDELRKDPYIVMSAVKQNGKALQFASNELKDNPYLVSIAIKQNEEALQFASRRLKASPNIISAAGRLQDSDRLVRLEKELTRWLSPGVSTMDLQAVCREAMQDLCVIQQHSSHELSTHPTILDRRTYKLLRQLQSIIRSSQQPSFLNNGETSNVFQSLFNNAAS